MGEVVLLFWICSFGINDDVERWVIGSCVFGCLSSGERGVQIGGLEGSYCRNPDKDKHGPWCYTNNSAVPWDYCHIKPCECNKGVCASESHTISYRGQWKESECVDLFSRSVLVRRGFTTHQKNGGWAPSSYSYTDQEPELTRALIGSLKSTFHRKVISFLALVNAPLSLVCLLYILQVAVCRSTSHRVSGFVCSSVCLCVRVYELLSLWYVFDSLQGQ